MEISLEERVEALSAYMDECQKRVLGLGEQLLQLATLVHEFLQAEVDEGMLDERGERKEQGAPGDLTELETNDPMAAPYGPWIPPENALPDMDKEVLVFLTRCGGFEIASRKSFPDGWGWVTGYGHEVGVSFWMPLPGEPRPDFEDWDD